MRAYSEFIRFDHSKDLVIGVLGWQRAKPQLVQKYAQLYNHRGYDTIQYTAKAKAPWVSYVEQLRDVRELARDVAQVRHEGRPLAWHVMSMNGAVILAALDSQKPQLKAISHSEGILFDSAPVPFRLAEMDMVVEQGMPKENSNSLLRIIYRAHLARRFSDLEIRRRLGMKVGRYASYDYFTEHEGFPRQLAVVYSDADKISKASSVSEFIAFNRFKGRNVEELHLTKSPHVGHLKMYPQEYENLIDRFLSRIEENKKN